MNALIKSLFVAISVSSLSICAYANTPQPVSTDANSITWTDMPSLPGAKYAVLAGDPTKKAFYIIRVKFPAKFSVSVHNHPNNEYDTVMSGTYYFGTGTELNTNDGVALPTGTFIMIPAKLSHYGWTKEETVLQISGIGPWTTNYEKANRHTAS